MYNTRHGFSDLDFDWHGRNGRFRAAYDDIGLPGPISAGAGAAGAISRLIRAGDGVSRPHILLYEARNDTSGGP